MVTKFGSNCLRKCNIFLRLYVMQEMGSIRCQIARNTFDYHISTPGFLQIYSLTKCFKWDPKIVQGNRDRPKRNCLEMRFAANMMASQFWSMKLQVL